MFRCAGKIMIDELRDESERKIQKKKKTKK